MKLLLKRLLQRYGYDLVRYVELPESPFDILKLVVDARVSAGKSVRFVQVGANDGVRNDPIRELVVKYKLPGLLVEPLPDLFERLCKNYAEHPQVEFEQCAVGEQDGEGTLYRVRSSPDLPEWLQGIGSFDKKHLSSAKFGFPNLESYVEPVTIPVMTVSSLLKKHNMTDFDLLQVDTEGFDCRIVQATLQAGLCPAVINYEYIHTLPEERVRCKQLLKDKGYGFVDMGRDTLAVHKTALEV